MTFYQQESACLYLFFFFFTLKYPVSFRKRKRVLEPFACRIMTERTAENGGNFQKRYMNPHKNDQSQKSVKVRLSWCE